MEGGTWQAILHAVATSQTRQKDEHFTSLHPEYTKNSQNSVIKNSNFKKNKDLNKDVTKGNI